MTNLDVNQDQQLVLKIGRPLSIKVTPWAICCFVLTSFNNLWIVLGRTYSFHRFWDFGGFITLIPHGFQLGDCLIKFQYSLSLKWFKPTLFVIMNLLTNKNLKWKMNKVNNDISLSSFTRWCQNVPENCVTTLYS